ncbi:MAG: hypothetical protein QME41_03705 [Actinomycetota bacterium]|nr:hypothetical protein [Actinomycetota bacterium]
MKRQSKILCLAITALLLVVPVQYAYAAHGAAYITASSEFGGSYAEWGQTWYPDPGSLPHHNNHTLWFWTNGTTGYSANYISFVALGYWHGAIRNFSADWNGFYWERQIANGDGTYFYDYRGTSAVLPGANGTNHTFTVQSEYINGYPGVRGYIDGTRIIEFQQPGPHKQTQVGLESTLSNAQLGHTYPQYLQYKSAGVWKYWNYGAIRANSPYRWAWRDGVYYKGDDWNSNY